MSDQPTRRLSGDQILALKFAAHRQLARWANKPTLNPHQQAQRSALKSAVRVLQDRAFVHGCELRVPDARKTPMGDDWRKIEHGLFESPDGQWRISNPWKLKTELRHRWLVAERRASGSGWSMHDGDHATLQDARAYVETRRRRC